VAFFALKWATFISRLWTEVISNYGQFLMITILTALYVLSIRFALD